MVVRSDMVSVYLISSSATEDSNMSGNTMRAIDSPAIHGSQDILRAVRRTCRTRTNKLSPRVKIAATAPPIEKGRETAKRANHGARETPCPPPYPLTKPKQANHSPRACGPSGIEFSSQSQHHHPFEFPTPSLCLSKPSSHSFRTTFSVYRLYRRHRFLSLPFSALTAPHSFSFNWKTFFFP